MLRERLGRSSGGMITAKAYDPHQDGSALEPPSDLDAPADPVLGQITLSLDPVPASVAAARRAVDNLLAATQSSDEFCFSVQLVVSELMTNAIVHGSPSDPIDLNLSLHGGDVDIRIQNIGLAPGIKNLPRDRSEGGRGLQIVASLTERWSIANGPTATIASARVPARPTPP